MLPNWSNLVCFHNFVILLNLAFPLFNFLKQWGFLPFMEAGMSGPPVQNLTWKQPGWQKQQCKEKTAQKKTAKQNCPGSLKLLTRVFANINSLVSSRILNMQKGSFLKELSPSKCHAEWTCPTCSPTVILWEPKQERREKTSARFAKQNMLHLCPWEELLTRHQCCSLEEATAFLLMPPPCGLHWNPKASSSSSWADKPQPSLSFCVSVFLLAGRDNKITQHSGML